MIMYLHIHTYSQRENKIILVSPSEVSTGGWRDRKKMLENEKY
jgi:hypothetical protein